MICEIVCYIPNTPQGKLLLLVRNQSEKALEYYFTSLVCTRCLNKTSAWMLLIHNILCMGVSVL